MIGVARSIAPSCNFVMSRASKLRSVPSAEPAEAIPTAACVTTMANASSSRKRKGAQVNSTPIESTAIASKSTAAAVQQSTDLPRCKWPGAFSGATSEQYIRYHDEEWGRPVYDDTALFELLVLEGAQAGLSWSTILARRDFYRTAFEEFDPVKVAAFNDAKLTQLMAEGCGVVRHRGKLESAVQNAKAFVQLQQEHGSFCNYVWSFVPDHRPIVNRWTSISEVPAKTAESEALSKGLKKAGMSFVGPTIMYAFMQVCLLDSTSSTCIPTTIQALGTSTQGQDQ